MIKQYERINYEERISQQAKEAETDPWSELFLKDIEKIQRKYQK